MPTKSLFTSRTFWFNALTVAAQVAGVIPLPPQDVSIIMGAINIGLRLFTSKPVTVVPQ